MGKIQCLPKAELLRALAANNKLDWLTALGEWIDNALDAGASTISIVAHGKRFISIEDNGSGCGTLQSFITLGDHRKHKSTSLGRYGIGAKDAALWIGGERSSLSIRSTHGSTTRSMEVNWQDMAASDWCVEAPMERTAEPGARGTRLRVEPVVRHLPDLRSLMDGLGFIYSPAIKRGAQITMQRGAERPVPIVRWELPPFEPDHVDTTVIAAGRKARVRCGIVKEGQANRKSGLSYVYDYRVVIPASSHGCGDHSISRICGFVDLDRSWPLSKNKDGLTGSDQEELFAAVENAIRPVLERAERAGITLQSRTLADSASALLSSLIASRKDAKAKRRQAIRQEKAVPTGTGTKHTRAEVEQDGQTFPGKRGGNRVMFDRMGDESVGRMEGPHFYLNLDNPMVAAAHASNNPQWIVSIAMALVASHHCIEDEKGQMLLLRVTAPRNDFAKVWGELISAKDLAVNGRPIVDLRPVGA